ncbi:MAG: flagellar motor protein MotB, partial [Proteobacteria bacterium]|nr:flagellar motor protein MotB [Pseudomonadota bacterium]
SAPPGPPSPDQTSPPPGDGAAVMAASLPGVRLYDRFRGESDKVDGFHLSFADLMSLLLVFFVVMFAMTAGRPAKVATAFTGNIGPDVPPKPVARPSRTGADPLLFAAAGTNDGLVKDALHRRQWAATRGRSRRQLAVSGLLGADSRPDLERRRRRLAGLLAGMRLLADAAVRPGDIRVYTDQHQLVIVLAERITFASAQAGLLPDAQRLLPKLARLIQASDLRVLVQGHTDDQPLHGGRFPTNWELSAARAAAVARFLIQVGVSAASVSIQGFASTRAVADNDSPQGRAKNRRVEIRLSLPPGA